MTSLKSSFNQYSVNQVMKSRQTSLPQLCKDKCQIRWRWKKTYWKQGVLFHIPVQQTGTLFISIFLTRMTLTFMCSISPGSFGRVHRSVLGFSGGSVVKELKRQCRRRRRCGLDPWVGMVPWRRKWQPTPVFLSGESCGQRSLAGCSPQHCREVHVMSNEHAHTHTGQCIQDGISTGNEAWKEAEEHLICVNVCREENKYLVSTYGSRSAGKLWVFFLFLSCFLKEKILKVMGCKWKRKNMLQKVKMFREKIKESKILHPGWRWC